MQAEDRPLYLREFPDFDDELKSIEGFKDDSWHNDAMPKIIRSFYEKDKSYPVRTVEVFQDYAQSSRSEFGEAVPYCRYYVDVVGEDGSSEDLLLTSSWAEARACALQAVEKIAAEMAENKGYRA